MEDDGPDQTPIPAKCPNRKCGFSWTGRDAIRAPSLANVYCFWCHTKLVPHPGWQQELSLSPDPSPKE